MNISENINNTKGYNSVILVGNPQKYVRDTKIRFFEKPIPESLLKFAQVKVKLSPDLQSKITPKSEIKGLKFNSSDGTYHITNNASIDNIILDPGLLGTITLTVNFYSNITTEINTFNFYIEQYEGERLVGGESFVVNKTSNRNLKAEIGIDNGFGNLSLRSIFEYPNTDYNWYDLDGNLLYTGLDFLITDEIKEKYKLELISLEDGFIDYSEINLDYL